MIIQQMSVFLENHPGAVVDVLSVLAANKINIKAVSLADTADFGILRILVTNPVEVKAVLQAAGVVVKLTALLAIAVEDQPGELVGPIQKLSEAGINVEYMYSFAGIEQEGRYVAIKVDDVEKAEQVIYG